MLLQKTKLNERFELSDLHHHQDFHNASLESKILKEYLIVIEIVKCFFFFGNYIIKKEKTKLGGLYGLHYWRKRNSQL
jgi:hypothetical protein